MALIGKLGKRKEGEKEIETFSAEFTNGTIAQLREIARYLEGEGIELPKKSEDEKLREVVSIGIAWLESLKEAKTKEKAES